MINLLPSDERSSLIYARRNTKLLRLAVAIIAFIILLLATWGAGYLYMASSIKSYATDVESKQTALKQQNIEEVEKRLADFSGSLKLIEQVLSKQVLFSELFRQVGAIMPNNTVLSSIEISKVEGGIDLTAKARNYDSATQIQVNLEDPRNKLFNKVDIISVSCGNSEDSSYPCTVSLRALFTDKNPFLLINKSEQKKTETTQ